jgi:DNA polymerase-3 subunit gamma/tau
VDKLGEIVQREGIKISKEALCSIARLANGGVRDAESILDRMPTCCNDEITIEAINSAYGLADAKTIDDIISSIYYGNYKKLRKNSQEFLRRIAICTKYCVMWK